MAKGQKTGGRKKGTKNRDISPLAERAKELGVDPFEVLLLFAKGDWRTLGYKAETYIVYGKEVENEELYITPGIRAKAAAEASQYLYPKLKAIEHSGEQPLSMNVIINPEDIKKVVQEINDEF